MLVSIQGSTLKNLKISNQSLMAQERSKGQGGIRLSCAWSRAMTMSRRVGRVTPFQAKTLPPWWAPWCPNPKQQAGNTQGDWVNRPPLAWAGQWQDVGGWTVCPVPRPVGGGLAEASIQKVPHIPPHDPHPHRPSSTVHFLIRPQRLAAPFASTIHRWCHQVQYKEGQREW